MSSVSDFFIYGCVKAKDIYIGIYGIHKMMGQKLVKTTRHVAVIALLSALYSILGGASGLLVGPLLRGYPAHFFRGLTMSMTAAYSQRRWSTTLMGFISGLIFLVIVPAPASYLLASSLVAGLAYDAVIMVGGRYAESSRRRGRIVLGTVVSSVAEAVVALSILTYVGLLEVQAMVLAMIWLGAAAANIVLSLGGASITVLLLRRFK